MIWRGMSCQGLLLLLLPQRIEFTHWSSLDSPTERMSPQNALVRDILQDINQPDNQTVQPGLEPAQIEMMGNILSDDVTFPSTHRQLNQVGTSLMDRETNMSDIEVRSQREGRRVVDSSNDEVILPNNRHEQIPLPHSNLSLLRYDTELLRGSCTRTHDTEIPEMIPQLDGPISVHSRRRMSENARTVQESFQRTAMTHRREYPDGSSNDSHSDRRAYNDRRPPERRRYQGRSGKPPDRGNDQDRGYSRRGRTPDGSGGSPDNGGPLMVEDSLIMEGPLEMDDIQDTLEDEDYQAHQDPLGQ